jgi:acetolactate synthase small subunit
VVHTDARTIKQIVKQLEKQVEVLQAFSAQQPDVTKQIETQLHYAS